MAIDKKKIEEDERKLAEVLNKANELLAEHIKERPYLLVLSTIYELEREGNKSKIAGQWNWRSNVDARQEGVGELEKENRRKVVKLLVEQVQDALERKEIGVKAKYKLV
ncbi:MAG: hypothetical protein N3G22_02850 [Candidatus Micrarchaeota archaeon]|nr:hypothetical protein [Candidatus Micrarchaeota archaeon]